MAGFLMQRFLGYVPIATHHEDEISPVSGRQNLTLAYLLMQAENPECQTKMIVPSDCIPDCGMNKTSGRYLNATGIWVGINAQAYLEAKVSESVEASGPAKIANLVLLMNLHSSHEAFNISIHKITEIQVSLVP